MQDQIPNEEYLIEKYIQLIRYAINRWYPYRRNVEYEDLFQIASIALLTAWRKYDPARGASFATFALLKIKSALYDTIRHNTAQKRRGIVISLFQEIGDDHMPLIDLIPDPDTIAGHNLYRKRGSYMSSVRNAKPLSDASIIKSLDLSAFVVFNATNSLTARGAANITVTKNGKITMSSEVGKRFAPGEGIEVLLNPVGTIVALRSSPIGIRCRQNGKDSEGKLISCANAKIFLESKQVELPARYRAEWDEEIGAWVGRR